MIELVNISKSYRIGPTAKEVLKTISMVIEKGDLMSIMGPSGSGKSTLMHILGLLDTGYTGLYRLDGKDISNMRDRELSTFRNKHVGFVFQSFNLLGNLTALENAALPLIYRGMGRREAHKRAHSLLGKVGMGDRFEHRPEQLSGGQKQRVAIARALVNSPSVILADEPTGALDSDTADSVIDLLLRLNRDQNVAVILITHNALIHRLAHRKAVIQDGLLLEAKRTAR